MRCSKCGSDNREGRKFCTSCGTPLAATCPKCGAPIQPDESFCGDCGASLSATNVALQAPAAETAPDLPLITERTVPSTTVEGERKTVTALFADLKGSTELMRDVDPEVAQAIIDPALKIMVEAVRYYDGYVVQSTGDGIFALFGAPLAHEDHPQRSLYAALRMQEGLRSYAERLSMESKRAVVARVGVNSGEVVMRAVETGGRLEYTPVGYVTNLASRMQTAAPAGGIAISEETRRLVEGYVELRALGPTELKGVAEPIEVYQVIGLGPLRTHFEVSTRRGLTKFVGREHELAQMRRALELAMGGHGQVVAIVAEAGAGKSRLVYEFKALLPSGCKLLEAYSVSYGKASAWLPVLELLRGYFGIESADDPATRREKVLAALAALDPGLNDTLPYLLGLLGIQEMPDPLAQMDAQIRQRRTCDAIKQIIVSESLVQPVVVIFEDLHWIDGETQALLELVADSIVAARVLLLVNYRPEYRHQWANKAYYSQLRLDALGRESASEIVAALLGDSAELGALKHLMIEHTRGNPFFIEEMVQALFDEGALVRNGTVKLVRPLQQLRMPPTVQGILAARIDRLSREEKDLLQTLAVVGRKTPVALIKEMVTKPRIERMLETLQAGEFICEGAASGEIEYTFKHALTQYVAYNSLLIEQRKVLHERTGMAMESLYADQLDDQLDELARHYSRSDNIAKAVEYLGRAGQQSMQRSIHSEAISNLRMAIELLSKQPSSSEGIHRELFLQLALGSALTAVKGWPALEVERAFTRAHELCEQLGDPPELFATMFGLWTMYYFRAQLRRAYELAEQLLSRAQLKGTPAQLLLARQALGDTSFEVGDLLAAKDHFELAISLYDHEPRRSRVLRYGGVDAAVVSLSYGAWILWLLGYPEKALLRANEALTVAQGLSHPLSLVFAEFFLSVLYKYRRELAAAQLSLERAIALADEHGFSLWSAVGAILSGWIIAQNGRADEGFVKIQDGLLAYRASGAEAMRPQFLCWLAEAYRDGCRFESGLAAVTEALAATDEHEDRFYEAETHRLKGDLLLTQDHTKAASALICFRQAIEVAREQSAKSWELRATINLARLLASQGRRHEARSTLSEIYGWFTEGFDTADLKEAKALLEELTPLNT